MSAPGKNHDAGLHSGTAAEAGKIEMAGEARETGMTGEVVEAEPAGEAGARALAIARTWLGTPYRHQGSLKGVGCDCLGLIRGVWRTLYGTEPSLPPPYRPDWAERGPPPGEGGGDLLLEAARLHFGPPLAADVLRPGDLLLFRWREGMPAKHAGLLADASHFIHAYEQAAVVISPLVPAWRRRIAAIHRFPERIP